MKLSIGTTLLICLAFGGLSRARSNGNFSSSDKSAQGSSAGHPHVSISVYDRAGVPSELLIAAEEEARRIFQRAGVETIWLNCSEPLVAGESRTVGCGTVGSGHLVAEILPRANSERLRFHLEVLGIALLTYKGGGFYCYLFYDRIARLTEEHLLKHKLLAHVLAHETGHLMLGSNSHSLNGIMSGQWGPEGLRRVSTGTLSFHSSESKHMRQRLNAFVADRNALNSKPICNDVGNVRTGGFLADAPTLILSRALLKKRFDRADIVRDFW